MWPLGVFLLFATAAPLQQSAPPEFQLHRTNPALQTQPLHHGIEPFQLEPGRSYSCFTMRSYIFHRQDGQAPVLTGTTTCTPSNLLRQRQAAPPRRGMYVPISDQGEPK